MVNALVDADEAAARLPSGLRPHAVGGKTVVGCCLLELADIRPGGLPMPGVRMRAAAHRIAVELDGDVGVFVPGRLTDSRAARAIGGRLYPGVHRPAAITVDHDGDRLAWSVDPASHDDPPVNVAVSFAAAAAADPREPVGATCLAATIGVSPGHDGALEAVRMAPSHRCAARVEIDALDSSFLASFTTAQLAPAYLMRDVAVTWSVAA